jgi:hypothetical protein
MTVLLAGAALAQTGSVVGAIVDADGNPVEGARVMLMSGTGGHGGGHGGGGHGGGGCGDMYLVYTDAAGLFVFPEVVPGTYRLGASKREVGAVHVDEVLVEDGVETDLGVLQLVPKCNQIGTPW